MHYGLCENGGLRQRPADRQALICVFGLVAGSKPCLNLIMDIHITVN